VSDEPTPWWKDESYIIGKLSSTMRKIRLKNVLTVGLCTR
jgi:hypothetical protein